MGYSAYTAQYLGDLTCISRARMAFFMDIGLTNTGITEIDFVENSCSTHTWVLDSKTTKASISSIALTLEKVVNHYVDFVKGRVKDVPLSEVLIGMESVFVATGQTAPLYALFMMLAFKFRELGIPLVLCLPNGMSRYFMRQQKVSDKQVVEFVLSNYRNVHYSPKSKRSNLLNSHEADSLLMATFIYHAFFEQLSGSPFEVPRFEVKF